MPVIAERIGVTPSTLWYVSTGRNNTVATDIASAVRDTYDELYAADGPSARTRNKARRRGWAGPEAWTDETIDDPAARPGGHDIVDEVAIHRVLAGEGRFAALTADDKTALFREHATDWSNTRLGKVGIGAATAGRWRRLAGVYA